MKRSGRRGRERGEVFVIARDKRARDAQLEEAGAGWDVSFTGLVDLRPTYASHANN